MEFTPPNLNLAKLKRKIDITNLTIQIQGANVYSKGRFYVLWRNGNFLVIQAEPWSRPGLGKDLGEDLEGLRALWHVQEIIQTMVDDIIFDGENNWAYLVRLPKANTYRLVYDKRQLMRNFTIWRKVVELDDIEVTRFTSGLSWEGIYEGEDVDLFVGWEDDWAAFVSAESRGQKLVESKGLGRYFFELKAHVAKNGVIVGIMMEALVGRSITSADRPAVYEAVADIQRHDIFFAFQKYDIYITERGVRFASASSAKYCQDRDELARRVEFMWEMLTDIFTHMDDNPMQGYLVGSRSVASSALIMPRLPSPGRPLTLTPEEAIIRWVWSTATSDECAHCPAYAFRELPALYRASEHSATGRAKRVKGDDKTLLLPGDPFGDLEASATSIESMDTPHVAQHHTYGRRMSRQLLLLPDYSYKENVRVLLIILVLSFLLALTIMAVQVEVGVKQGRSGVGQGTE